MSLQTLTSLSRLCSFKNRSLGLNALQRPSKSQVEFYHAVPLLCTYMITTYKQQEQTDCSNYVLVSSPALEHRTREQCRALQVCESQRRSGQSPQRPCCIVYISAMGFVCVLCCPAHWRRLRSLDRLGDDVVSRNSFYAFNMFLAYACEHTRMYALFLRLSSSGKPMCKPCWPYIFVCLCHKYRNPQVKKSRS